MAEHRADNGEKSRVAWQQKILDNIWLLLVAGILIPTVIYILWGLWELAEVPLWGGGG